MLTALISRSVIADEDKPLLEELVSVKERVPGLKVVLAVGGWAFSCVLNQTLFELELMNVQ